VIDTLRDNNIANLLVENLACSNTTGAAEFYDDPVTGAAMQNVGANYRKTNNPWMLRLEPLAQSR